MRLNRFLASAGLGSRRSCEELIRTGQVTVNGATCENLATNVEPTDVIKLGNQVLRSASSATILLHKPPGFLCTASDTHERRTIFELLPSNFPRLFHVGRLDRESEGLIILTNDGELSLKLTHPRYKVEKEYEVVLDKAFDFELTSKLVHGMTLEEGFAKAESVFKLGSTKLKVVLRQGMKRQIRMMFYALGYEVKRLVRVRIGSINIQSMPAGSWRVLTQKEIDALLAEGAKGGDADTAERRDRKSRPNLRNTLRRDWSKRPAKPGTPSEAVESIEIPRRSASARPASARPDKAPASPRTGGRDKSFSERSERPRSTRPGSRPESGSKSGPRASAKPSGKRPSSSKSSKPTGRPGAKAGPRPFAKFEKRSFPR